MSISAIRITATAIIDKMETYRKNAPVLPRSRIPEKAKIKLCMLLDRADGMPPSCAAATAFRNGVNRAELILLDPEAYNIYAAVRRTAKILGAIAELGVFRGGSARLICEAKGNRQLRLFDTFVGMPENGEDDPRFGRGVLVGSLPNVQAYLGEFPNVFFHQGFFPDSAAGLEDMRFSFVHLVKVRHSRPLPRGSRSWASPPVLSRRVQGR